MESLKNTFSRVNGDKLAQHFFASECMKCLRSASPKNSRKGIFQRFHKTYNLQPKTSLFGIVQGATDTDLRKKSAHDIVKIGFDGYAIGGLSVGEKAEDMYVMLDATVPELPEDQPRYLMGVGTPANIIEAVARGIDMFDCVLPTRNARHGYLFTSQGMIHLRNKKYREDFTALDPACDCITCTKYHKAYLRHLLIAGEVLVIPLLVRHNLRYYLRLMQRIRESIINGRFEQLRGEIAKSEIRSTKLVLSLPNGS